MNTSDASSWGVSQVSKFILRVGKGEVWKNYSRLCKKLGIDGKSLSNATTAQLMEIGFTRSDAKRVIDKLSGKAEAEAKEKKGKEKAPVLDLNISDGKVMRAVLRIQSMFKGFKGRHQFRMQLLQQAWDELERKEESEIRGSNMQIFKMTEMYKKLKKDTGSQNLLDATPQAIIQKKEDSKASAASSRFVPTLSWLTDFMDEIQKPGYRKVQPMKEADLLSLIEQTRIELSKFPNVINVQIKADQSLIVVGDLHGQVADILHILHEHGFPRKRKMFLFNGDFVDRGSHSIEVTIILFALKYLFGPYVFLNRGNHEAKDINERDGFLVECSQRYNTKVWERYNKAFAALPLAHILNQEILVLHGGLFYDEGVTISKIKQQDRFVEIPPFESIMEDLMWSDPGGPSHHGASQSDRGCGCIFGEDICDEFFEDNAPIRMIIRSHEKKQSGFQRHFGGKVVTVFSASNYCGDNENDGAVIEVFSDLKYQVHQFYAAASEKDRLKSRFHDRFVTLSQSVSAKLIFRIGENRLKLLDYYVKEAKGATITRSQWAQGMKTVLKLKIKFLALQAMLGLPAKGVDGKSKGKIDYADWLSKFAPSHEKLSLSDAKAPKDVQESLQKIISVLQKHRVAMKSMFRYFDTNNDGIISPEELTNGLKCLGAVYGAMFSQKEAETVVKFLDKDGSNGIDYKEFLECFSVKDKMMAQALLKVPKSSVMRGGTLSTGDLKRTRNMRRSSKLSKVH